MPKNVDQTAWTNRANNKKNLNKKTLLNNSRIKRKQRDSSALTREWKCTIHFYYSGEFTRVKWRVKKREKKREKERVNKAKVKNAFTVNRGKVKSKSKRSKKSQITNHSVQWQQQLQLQQQKSKQPKSRANLQLHQFKCSQLLKNTF